MVIGLSGVQIGLNSFVWTLSEGSIWNQKYDFRPKAQDGKLNYHFITAI